MTIKHSPETLMPEPYKSYIAERADNIARTLEPIVGETNIQLCPSAITPDQRAFSDGIVYGAVVKDIRLGHKSILYQNTSEGIHATSYEQAAAYTQMLLDRGEEVRLKQPEQSDGDGQFRVTSLKELYESMTAYQLFAKNGVVLMPQYDSHDSIERYSMGLIDLENHGYYAYIGSEAIGTHKGRETFLGGTIAVARTTHKPQLLEQARRLDIPPRAIKAGFGALRAAMRQMDTVGRISVDVVEASTTSGRRTVFVPDITVRVGGHEGPIVDSIDTLQNPEARVAIATGKLMYNPTHPAIATGKRYIDTETLIMTSTIDDVIEVAA